MRGGWFKESVRHRLARQGVKTAYYAKQKSSRAGTLTEAWFHKGENLLPSSYKAANRVPVGKLIVAGKKTPSMSKKAGERVLPESREAGEEMAEDYMAKKKRHAVSDKIKGGLGDHLPDEMFDKKQLRKGMRVELEHTRNPVLAKEIAKDHLVEDPKYYDKLAKMEKGKC